MTLLGPLAILRKILRVSVRLDSVGLIMPRLQKAPRDSILDKIYLIALLIGSILMA